MYSLKKFKLLLLVIIAFVAPLHRQLAYGMVLPIGEMTPFLLPEDPDKIIVPSQPETFTPENRPVGIYQPLHGVSILPFYDLLSENQRLLLEKFNKFLKKKNIFEISKTELPLLSLVFYLKGLKNKFKVLRQSYPELGKSKTFDETIKMLNQMTRHLMLGIKENKIHIKWVYGSGKGEKRHKFYLPANLIRKIYPELVKNIDLSNSIANFNNWLDGLNVFSTHYSINLNKILSHSEGDSDEVSRARIAFLTALLKFNIDWLRISSLFDRHLYANESFEDRWSYLFGLSKESEQNDSDILYFSASELIRDYEKFHAVVNTAMNKSFSRIHHVVKDLEVDEYEEMSEYYLTIGHYGMIGEFFKTLSTMYGKKAAYDDKVYETPDFSDLINE